MPYSSLHDQDKSPGYGSNNYDFNLEITNIGVTEYLVSIGPKGDVNLCILFYLSRESICWVSQLYT